MLAQMRRVLQADSRVTTRPKRAPSCSLRHSSQSVRPNLRVKALCFAVMGPQMLRALLPANAELAAFVEAPDDVLSYGASSTKLLHELDHAFEGNDCTRGRILIAAPADTPEWAAVNDRLKRATA